MSLLKRLFGGGASKPQTEPVEHNGYRIFPEPQSTSGGHRIAARIEKDFGTETKTHHMIRADVISNREEVESAIVNKARQVIDEQGDQIFT
jgi:hypothetical protein